MKAKVGDTITFKPLWGRYEMRKTTRKVTEVRTIRTGRKAGTDIYTVTSAYGCRGFQVEEREVLEVNHG